MSVLILGMPRSGTTWLLDQLTSTPGTRRVYEPDNEGLHADAAYAKRGLGRFPLLEVGEPAPAYGRLWDRAFGDAAIPSVADRLDSWHRRLRREELYPARTRPLGWLALHAPRRRDGARPIVKSVHAPLCAEWVADRVGVEHVVVLTRDPLNVIASWVELRMPDADRRLDDDARLAPDMPLPTPLHRMAWQFGVLERALLEAAERNPGWIVERHEALVEDPVGRIPAIAEAVGLDWGEQSTQRLLASNTSGAGHNTARRWADLKERWRRTLSDEDAAVVRDVLGHASVG